MAENFINSHIFESENANTHRENLKAFVDKSICPQGWAVENEDLRVDAYGDFKIYFEKIKGDFATKPDTNGLPFFNDDFGPNEDLHPYIKNINDVELNINARTLDLPGMSYALHRLMPMPSQNTIAMLWLNTKTPYIERVFIPWMQENTLYGKFPMVKCNLRIIFPKLENSNFIEMIYPTAHTTSIEYLFYGIRPVEVSLHKMTNEPLQDFYRRITFDFDYFWSVPGKPYIPKN